MCASCAAASALGAALPVHLGTLRALDRALAFPLAQMGRIALGGAALDEAARLVTRFLASTSASSCRAGASSTSN